MEYLDPRENDLELAKDLLRDSEYDALLYIPSGENWDPDFIKNNILLFGKEDPSMELQGYLDYLLEEQINQAKLLKNGVDPEIVAQIKTNVNIKSFTLGEEGNDEQSAVPIKMSSVVIIGSRRHVHTSVAVLFDATVPSAAVFPLLYFVPGNSLGSDATSGNRLHALC